MAHNTNWPHNMSTLSQRTSLLASTTALCLTLFATSDASAQGYCSNVSEPGLAFGCAETLSNSALLNGGPSPTSNFVTPLIGSNNGLVFDSDWASTTGERLLRFNNDVVFTNPLYSNFENVYIGSTRSDGQQTPLTITALPNIPSGHPQELQVKLQFDRLTLENTDLTFRRSVVGNDAGQIETLTLGDDSVGRGGALVLRNSSFSIVGATKLRFRPSTTPVISAESGSNLLSIGDQRGLADTLSFAVGPSAELIIRDSEIRPDTAGTLAVATGGRLVIDESLVDLSKTVSSSVPDPTFENAELELDGSLANLILTSPEFRDSDILLKGSSTLSIEARDSGGTRIGSVIEFVGDNTVTFAGQQSTLRGPDASVADLNFRVRQGTTRVSNSILPGPQAGLRVFAFQVSDQGTLDLTDLRMDSIAASEIFGLTVQNGSTFQDSFENPYSGLAGLNVSNSTLRSVTPLGAFSAPRNGTAARLENATIDIAGAVRRRVDDSLESAALGDLRINANQLRFVGDNRVLLGVSPQGECILSGGSCIPGTEVFSGGLVTSVGNAPDALFEGFDTVLFVPIATDPTASAADYVAGGRSGVYTVARHNTDGGLLFNQQPYNAPPRTPTASDLAAAGSTIPANLTYTIVNDPISDDQVNIAFIDVGLTNNPLVTPTYTPQTTTSVVTNPINGNQTTTTIVTTPTNGGATQTVTTTITAPGGGVISTNTITNTLGPATGTTNTSNYGQLVTNSGNTLTHSGLQNVSTLHPEAYASFMTVALEQSDLRRNMVLSNANGRASGNGRIEGVTADGRSVWFDAGLTRGKVDADGGLAGFDYDLNEFILGADVWADNRSRVGAYFGYGTYSMTDHTTSTDTLDFSSDAFSIGAYGVMETTNWSFSGMAGVSWGNTDATRDAVTGTGVNRHTANYDHRTYEIAARAVYTSLPSRGGWHFAPEVGLGYARYEQDGFTENGDLATALAVDNATAESLIGSLGLNVTGPAFGGGLIPLGFIRYEHDFLAASDGTHDIDAAFASSPGTSQTFVGTHRGENAISVGLGLATALHASVDASAGLVYQKNSNGDEFGGGLRITWRF